MAKHNKVFDTTFLTLSLVFTFCCNVAVAQQEDRFADIGNKAAATRLQLLQQPLPPVLPDIRLPVSNKTGAAFKPMKRLETAAELQAELQTMRKRYAPFLQDLAPPIASLRSRRLIETVQWRIETEEDRQNFTGVVQGAGEWKAVTLPHYGPPLGKATTYYRTIFSVSDEDLNAGALLLHFNGVDYKAAVFVNGFPVITNEGSFMSFEANIKPHIKKGENVLLVKVENDYPMLGHVGDNGRKFDGDKFYAATGMGYDEPTLGWHHNPPGMGINQQVYLETRAAVHISDVFVRPIGNSDTAEVWLEVANLSTDYQPVSVRYSVYGQNFSETMFTGKNFTPTTVHIPGVGDLAKPTDWEQKKLSMGLGVNFLKFQIILPKARRWSPETPWLYQLQLALVNERGAVVDRRANSFGMRSFVLDTVSSPKGMPYLNGAPIRLRGANNMGNLMLSVMRQNWQQLVDDILLAKIANINYLRMTQLPAQSEVYAYCDRLGMLTQTDLPLFGVLRRNKWAEAVRQAYEMERLVRGHPSNILVTYINERFPNAEGAPQRHFATYEEFERFFTAADQAVLTANPDRVIKAGDGDYDPPSPGLPDNHCYNLWYNGHGLGIGEMIKGYWLPVKPGWYYACGEFGAEGLDPLNTALKYYPKDWLPLSLNEFWTPAKIAQSQTARFHAMWFSPQTNIRDWIKASQTHQAEATKLTAEAFRRDSRMVSFAIHLFIDAWPAGWMKAIMDVDRQPKPAYFAYRDALTPLAVQLRTDRHHYFSGDTLQAELWLCNDRNNFPEGSTIRYQVERDGKVVWANSVAAKPVINSSLFQGSIPWVLPTVTRRTDYTLRTNLVSANGEAVHENSLSFSVFPKEKSTQPLVYVFYKSGSEAALLQEVGITPVNDVNVAQTILANDSLYAVHQPQIDAAVQGGKRLLLLNLSTGVHRIANDSIVVTKPNMGQYYFVSPATGHPWVKGYGDADFKFWFERRSRLIRPLLQTMVQASGWKTVLLTGNTSWTGSNQYQSAVAEKNWGKGKVVISQLLLNGRLQDNPSAYQFFIRMLTQ